MRIFYNCLLLTNTLLMSILSVDGQCNTVGLKLLECELSTLFLLIIAFLRHSTGIIPCCGAKCRWGGKKSATFDNGKDRHIVSTKVEQDVVCALVNGNIALIGPNHLIFCITTAIHSFVTGEPRDFKFGTLIYHSKSHPADEKSSLEGAWSLSGDPF